MSTNILGGEKFSIWLRQAREKSGLSHKAVEEITKKGISKSYVGHLETEEVNPGDATLKKLIALAKGLNVPVAELINRAVEEELRRVHNAEVADLGEIGGSPEESNVKLRSQQKAKRKKAS